MPRQPIRGDDPSSTEEHELVVHQDPQGIDDAMRAATRAVERMSEEGRSGRVTVSMSVEVRQLPDDQAPAPLDRRQAAERGREDRRFALGMAVVCFILVTAFAGSFSFMPDLAAGLLGLGAAAWLYGHLTP